MTRAVLVLIAWLVLLQYGQPPRDTLYWNTLFDAGHALGFGAVTWALERMLRRRYQGLDPLRALLTAAVLALALGAASELAQLIDPRRHPSLGDLARDAAGAIGFVAISRLRFGAPSGGATRLALLSLLAGAAAVAGAPWLVAVAAYRQRDAAFPVIVPFDLGWERAFLTTNLVSRLPVAPTLEGTTHLMARLRLGAGRYPGVSVDELYPDWRAYDRLVFDIVLEGTTPVNLVLRVHDEAHTGETSDRFNRTFTLHPGRQHATVPLAEIAAGPARRRLDLAAVRGLSLFAPDLAAPVMVALSPIRLERGPGS